MFAFLGYTSDNNDTSAASTILQNMASHLGLQKIAIQNVQLASFQLVFFDTACELDVFRDDTHCLLLIGQPTNNIFNREIIEHDSKYRPAQQVFRAYQHGKRYLTELDGHFSFVLYDSQTDSITLAGDRFQRYSIVYDTANDVRVSSHSALLYPYLQNLRLGDDSFSSSVHFRWLTANKRLFANIEQVLAGSLTLIDKRGGIQREFYFVPRFRRRKAATVPEFTREVDDALDACLAKIAGTHDKIGIPLSGGVDSSLLLAKAKEHFKECIAVSARFTTGPNPELENAINTARALNVRHIVTEIDDRFVEEFFPLLVRLHEQPPRNFSDIALAKVLQTLSHEVDAFLYGEAADTFFGTSQVHSMVLAARRTALFRKWPRDIQRLIGRIVPTRPRRYALVRRLLINGIDNLVLTNNNIEYYTNPSRVFPCTSTPPANTLVTEHPDYFSLSIADRVSIQALATGVANHVENTGRLASYFGLSMYVPFLLNDLRAVGEELPVSLHSRNGVYKPVLRDLLSRYLDNSIVYSRKLGFPTPTLQWLDGPLKQRVSRCTEGKGQGRAYYSDTQLKSLAIERDFAIFWYAICLDEVCAYANTIVRDGPVKTADEYLYRA